MLEELLDVLNILENVSCKMNLKENLINGIVMTKNYDDGYEYIQKENITTDKDIGTSCVGMTIHVDRRISNDLLVYSFFKKRNEFNDFFSNMEKKINTLYSACI